VPRTEQFAAPSAIRTLLLTRVCRRMGAQIRCPRWSRPSVPCRQT